MKKRIMILGAGVYQVPLIKKAKEMGFETLVVSIAGNYPGISLADRFLEIDTTDVEKVVGAAKEHEILAVLTTGTDVCVPTIGAVVDALGLHGTGYDAACRSMDKVLMKQSFMKHSVPTAAFKMFMDSAEALRFANALGYPVMVKATDSSGSRGITKVNSEAEFSFAWERAYAVSRSKEIIVEQFLDGVEFGAQAFVHGDKVVAVFPHGDTVTPAPYFSPIGHSMPTQLTDDQQQKSAEVIEKAVQALGLRDCVSNVDLMLVDGEPKIIELGARMGATCLPENISIYAGIDAYEHLIRLALGDYLEIEVTARQANACMLLRSDESGTVAALNVPDAVMNHPDLVDLHWDVAVGDEVRAFKVGPDRIGHVIVKSETAEQGERLVEKLVSQIRIEIR
jgi:biotin carboxylase